jgi:two-component system chemotaxis response regulator CheB
MTRPIRVLVVEDSPSCRELLVGLLHADPRLLVVGTAADGEEAVEAAARLAPDVITMDIHLPGLDGFEATRRIMERSPTRIVVVTSSAIPHDVARSFELLSSGALAVLGKPLGPGHSDFAQQRDELLRTVALMAEVPVVRRRAPGAAQVASPRAPPVAAQAGIRLVAIGASTGGPQALQTLLSRLRPDFEVPLVIVQHMSPGFAHGLVEWLARTARVTVRVAAEGVLPRPGVAYVAPDGAHLALGGGDVLRLSDAPAENGFRPSVSHLFRSVAQHCGAQAAALLLTGMGQDGARELKTLRQAGALTMVQDRHSAVVHGMPGEALRLGAAAHVLAPEQMAVVLNRIVGSRG